MNEIEQIMQAALRLQPADSLRLATPPVTAESVFGGASTLTKWQISAAEAPLSIVESPIFQLVTLLMAVTYVVVVYSNLNDIRSLFLQTSVTKQLRRRTFDIPHGGDYAQFLNTALLLGIVFIGIPALAYFTLFFPQAGLSAEELLPVIFLLPAMLLPVCGGEWLLLKIVGIATLTQNFITNLIFIKRTFFALSVVVVPPTLLLFALCPDQGGAVWAWITAVEVVLILLLFLQRTLLLFISEKLSIFHWFLYLCIVEIFPISILGLIFVR
ncbi:MAG: DUF4271 domain-containing protein [Alistipes sp.]